MPARRLPPQPDPVRSRLRRARVHRGLSLRDVATRAGLRSAAYVFHIENGQRVPSEAVAERLAAALGEDTGLFRAWACALQRGDLASVLRAAGELLADPELAAFTAGRWREAAMTDAAPSALRLRVPVIAAGADPGDALHPECEVLRVLSLGPGTARGSEAWRRPFAYVLTAAATRRVPDLRPGHVAIVSRTTAAPAPDAVLAVRTHSGITLTRGVWNGTELLMLPAPGAADFRVLDAKDPDGLARRLRGVVVRVLQEPA